MKTAARTAGLEEGGERGEDQGDASEVAGPTLIWAFLIVPKGWENGAE